MESLFERTYRRKDGCVIKIRQSQKYDIALRIVCIRLRDHIIGFLAFYKVCRYPVSTRLLRFVKSFVCGFYELFRINRNGRFCGIEPG